MQYFCANCNRNPYLIKNLPVTYKNVRFLPLLTPKQHGGPIWFVFLIFFCRLGIKVKYNIPALWIFIDGKCPPNTL
jgi:hypothetical protein